MRRLNRRGLPRWWFVAIIAVLLLMRGLSCAGQGQPSFDMLPRADWAVDTLAWLAGKDKLQPFTARDFLLGRTFTRMEVAGILRDAWTTDDSSWDQSSQTERLAAQQLIKEFDSELSFLGQDVSVMLDAVGESPDRAYYAAGWGYADLARRGSDTSGRALGAVRITGFQDNASFGAVLTGERRLFHPDNHTEFSELDRFFFRNQGSGWDWEIGKLYSWYGTAETGSLWLGDSSPSMLTGRASKTFSLGRALGDIRFNWEVSSFSDQGRRVYLINKRLEKTLSSKWSLAYVDMAKTTETPNPLSMILPAPVYQSVFLDDVDQKWNALVGLEASYRPSTNVDTYLQWMVDDMTNPLQSGHSAPKKTGILAGVRLRQKGPMGVASRTQLEYAVIDERSYEPTRPAYPYMGWYRNDLPLAWPYGPNTRTISFRTVHKLCSHFDLTGTAIHSWTKEGPGHQTLLTLEPTYNLDSVTSVGVFLEHHSGDVDQTVTGVRGMIAF